MGIILVFTRLLIGNKDFVTINNNKKRKMGFEEGQVGEHRGGSV